MRAPRWWGGVVDIDSVAGLRRGAQLQSCECPGIGPVARSPKLARPGTRARPPAGHTPRCTPLTGPAWQGTALPQRRCQQTPRQPRWPSSATPRVPNGPNAPRDHSKDEEGRAVAVAALATARPRHPPRRPPADAEQRGPEAPADPSDHREEAEDPDQAGERATRGRDRDVWNGRHLVGIPGLWDGTIARGRGTPSQRRAPAQQEGGDADRSVERWMLAYRAE
jgi:hypothetical protein